MVQQNVALPYNSQRWHCNCRTVALDSQTKEYIITV